VSGGRLCAAAQEAIAAAIAEAGGREVSFVADVAADGTVTKAAPVSRGTVDAVLALPGVAARGQMVLHNHPSGLLEPSTADLDGGGAVLDVQLEEDDVNIVLDGPDREIERTSNRVVGMAVGHKFQNTLFAGSEALQITFSHQGPRRRLGNKGSASRHLADSSHDLFIRRVFDHVPRRTRIQG
jgi:hypothetical protein